MRELHFMLYLLFFLDFVVKLKVKPYALKKSHMQRLLEFFSNYKNILHFDSFHLFKKRIRILI